MTTIGFLKEAPHVSIHGFSIYHKNRLVLVTLNLLIGQGAFYATTYVHSASFMLQITLSKFVVACKKWNVKM